MNHQPLSASFVLGWASLNSAELSRSGRAVISIQLAWLTGPAEREVLCARVWVRPLVAHDSGLAFLLCPIEQVSPAIAPSQVLGGHGGQHGSSRKGFVSPGPLGYLSSQVRLRRGKLFPAYRRLCPGLQPRLHLARRWATPCQDCTAEEKGAPGRGQELPAPAWARRHTGRNVPSSAGPPSACRLPHPGIAECNPRAGGGCSQQR